MLVISLVQLRVHIMKGVHRVFFVSVCFIHRITSSFTSITCLNIYHVHLHITHAHYYHILTFQSFPNTGTSSPRERPSLSLVRLSDRASKTLIEGSQVRVLIAALEVSFVLRVGLRHLLNNIFLQLKIYHLHVHRFTGIKNDWFLSKHTND